MTSAIDMIGTSQGSGTRTYNLNFCEHLIKQNINKKTYIFITKDYLKNLNKNNNPKIVYIIKSKILTNIFIRILWMQFILPFELKKLKVNQLYSPMNIGPIFLNLFKIKLILALHSNLPWVYFSKMPGNILRNFFTRLMMEVSISACDKLIVDSNFAKDEIITLLKIKKDKVFVVYLGIDEKYLSHNRKKNYLEEFEYKNYIISVISCVNYHNIINLLKAFKLLKKDIQKDLKFVLVMQIIDKRYFSKINHYITHNLDKDDVIFFHNLNNKYLSNLYRKAEFYIFSSYCEVFGLTSLEAMSQDCPILISNKSALPEINANAAEYFDPDNVIQIKKSMDKVLFNNNYKKDLIEKGKIHYKNFNWQKTIEKTIKILDI